MAFDGTNVILFGGYDGKGPLADTWRWDGGWTNVTPAVSPPARERASMAFDGTHIILLGGYDGKGPLADTWK